MKRQSIFVVVALAAIALAAAGCSRTATNANNANASSNTSSTTTTTTTNTATTATTPAAGSPTAVMKESFNAVKNKDVAGFKKTLASADLKEMEEIFAKNGKTVDDFLKEMMELPSDMMPATLETRNEKIDGDKATVEYKQRDGSWKTNYFIKEGGEWKMKENKGKDESSDAGKDSGEMSNDNHKMTEPK